LIMNLMLIESFGQATTEQPADAVPRQ